MFEAQVVGLLQQFLGKYVFGLDAESLKISVWRGDVELRNLRLKPEALEELHLPITVKSGLLGRLTLKVGSSWGLFDHQEKQCATKQRTIFAWLVTACCNGANVNSGVCGQPAAGGLCAAISCPQHITATCFSTIAAVYKVVLASVAPHRCD